MKVLIVCSKNSGRIAPFIAEQAESLKKQGIEIDFYPVEQKGISGYLKSRTPLMSKIKLFHPDVIHAHYGLSGLLANLQRRIPVVTTYHGSDINDNKVFPFSLVSMVLSAHNIVVSERNSQKSEFSPIPLPGRRGRKEKQSLIPCGVDTELFVPMEKNEVRKRLSMQEDKRYVLFSGAFNNEVKNPGLALEAVKLLSGVELIELKGYTREQVVSLMNAADVALMTSFTEGSPQFIKEAMACNLPVVSVPVGDVPEIMKDIEGCYICTYDVEDVAGKLKTAMCFGKRTTGRERMLEWGLDLETVAGKIRGVYEKVMSL